MSMDNTTGAAAVTTSASEISVSSHLFKVIGYANAKGIGVGTCIESPAFDAAGRRWSIVFYPDGYGEDDDANEYISIYVKLVGGIDDVTVLYGFNLVDPTGAPPSREASKPPKVSTFEAGEERGASCFMERETFESSRYLNDGCFTIKCVVAAVKGPTMSMDNTTGAAAVTTSASEISVSSHLFKVIGYAKTKGIGVGRYIESPAFDAAGRRWSIVFYPDGDGDGDGDGEDDDDDDDGDSDGDGDGEDGDANEYISIYVRPVGGIDDVTVLYGFNLVDPTGAPPSREASKPLKVSTFVAGEERGASCFMERETFESSRYLNDDCFTMKCVVAAVKGPTMSMDNTTGAAAVTTSASEISVSSHLFKVIGYANTKGIGVGTCIESPAFDAAGRRWSIVFYPDGYGEDDDANEYISIYVKLVGGIDDVTVLYGFNLVDPTGAPPSREASKPPKVSTFEAGEEMGASCFMERETFESSRYLNDDCFTIKCVVAAVEGPAGTSAAPPASDLHQHFDQLQVTGRGEDDVGGSSAEDSD